MTPFESRASFAVFPFVDGSRRILGSNYGFADPAIDFPRYAQLVLDERLPVDRLIDRRIGLARPAAGVVRDGAEAAAAALGMTAKELRAQLRSGKDLKTIATEQGVPYATVIAAALVPVKARLDAAVASGTITRARADKVLARLEANLADGRLRSERPARPAASPTP